MSPHLFLLRAVDPGLSLLPAYMTSDCARVWLVTIAGQETNLNARRQDPDGPANSYWQFEQAGIDAVLKAQPALSLVVLNTLDIPPTQAHDAIRYNDALACAFARLLLWSDPAPLPLASDAIGGYQLYLRTWRPGRPDYSRWPNAHSTAMTAVCSQIC